MSDSAASGKAFGCLTLGVVLAYTYEVQVTAPTALPCDFAANSAVRPLRHLLRRSLSRLSHPSPVIRTHIRSPARLPGHQQELAR